MIPAPKLRVLKANPVATLQQVNETLEKKISDAARELKTALSLLQSSERSFGLLVDSVTDYALYMLDPTGLVVSWNVGAQRIKGYAASEIIGENFSCFYTDEDQTADLPAAGLKVAGDVGRLQTEGWRVRKDGTRFWAEVSLDAIRDRGTLVGFASITRDITDRNAAEAELRQAHKMEAIGHFTGGVAHDFNNLLAAISGSLELLRKRLPADEEMISLVEDAMQGAQRGASLTRRMLAFARRQELKSEAVDWVSVLKDTEQLLVQSAGITVNIETSIVMPLSRVRTDVSQITTALINLIRNASDAMPTGGTISICARDASVTIDHPTRLPAGLYGCLSVSDTGHGMDEATLARLAEPFFTTKGVGKGTGLGLSMVDGILAQCGGKLMARSQPGKGTTMEMWLPIASEETFVARTTQAGDVLQKRAALAPARKLVILAIDDDDLVLRTTVSMLKNLGHTVIAVDSGHKALTLIDRGLSVDLIISDQGMPAMTGVELAAAVKTLRPSLQTLIVTGYAELPPGTHPLLHRLAKPFSQRQLAAAMIESLAVH